MITADRRRDLADIRADDALVPRPWVVRRVVRELSTTVTLEVVPADGSPPPSFEPAQFAMLGVPGVGEVPISMSTNPADHDRHAVDLQRTARHHSQDGHWGDLMVPVIMKQS